MVELMVVLIIIALLTTLSAFAYRSVQVNASETAGVSMVEQVRKMAATNAALYQEPLLGTAAACADKDNDGLLTFVDDALCDTQDELTFTVFQDSPRIYNVTVSSGQLCWSTTIDGFTSISRGACS